MSDINNEKPTIIAYSEMQQAYDFFNKKVFSNKLPEILITFQRGKKHLGYFSPDRFNGKSLVSELAMNPDLFAVRSLSDVLSTLLHEMFHVWQYYADVPKPKTPAYHDRVWGSEMEKAGLIPSHNGLPGGRKTGVNMTHYIDPEGIFPDLIYELINSGYSISWFDQFGYKEYGKPISIIDKKIIDRWKNQTEDEELLKKLTTVIGQSSEVALIDIEDLANFQKEKKKKVKTKFKYICPECKKNIWGPSGINVICCDCDEVFVQEEFEED